MRAALQISAIALVGVTLSCQHDELLQQSVDLPTQQTASLSSERAIHVANQRGSVTVYAAGATGDATPTATISGENTGLTTPLGVALDGSGRLYVANHFGNSITVYAPDANGNATPTATISGENTGLFNPWGLAVDGSGKIYVVSNCVFADCPSPSVTIYAPGATGDATPLATIRGNNTGLHVPTGLAIDGSGKLYVANNSPPASITVYAAGSNGNTAPIATITGSNTGLNFPTYLAVDGSGKLFVVNHDATITVYAAEATGNATPIATIGGSNTGLASPSGVAVDGSGKLYVVNVCEPFADCPAPSVRVYAAGATGNVAPLATISGSNTGLDLPSGITLTPTSVTGALTVTTATTGTDLDSDGYAVVVDNGAGQPIGANATVTLPGLTAGDHTIRLTGVATNCSVEGGDTRTLSIVAGGITEVSYVVSCSQALTVVACVEPNPPMTPCAHTKRVAGFITPDEFPPDIFASAVIERAPPGATIPAPKWTLGSAEGPEIDRGFFISLGPKLGPGKHTVVVTATDDQGNEDTDQVEITIEELVVLVHGWHGSPATTFGVGGQLLGRDYLVLAYNYSGKSSCTSSVGIAEIADDFQDFIQNKIVAKANGYTGNINVLAHSTGGLVTRQFMINASYDQEFKRVVMAGTPNYGLDKSRLGKLASCLKAPGQQERDLLFSSDFVWKLHAAWSQAPQDRPIDPRNILALAGQLNMFVGGLGDGDGVTRAWSAAMPFERMFSIAFVPLGHTYVEFLGVPVGVLRPNETLVLLPELAASNAYSYEIVKEFFESGELPGFPDFSIPNPEIKEGLLLLRVLDDATGQPIDLTKSCTKDRCDPITIESIDFGGSLRCPLRAANCKLNHGLGLLTFAGIPGGRYRLSADGFTQYALPADPVEFTIFNGRPLGLEVRLRRVGR